MASSRAIRTYSAFDHFLIGIPNHPRPCHNNVPNAFRFGFFAELNEIGEFLVVWGVFPTSSRGALVSSRFFTFSLWQWFHASKMSRTQNSVKPKPMTGRLQAYVHFVILRPSPSWYAPVTRRMKSPIAKIPSNDKTTKDSITFNGSGIWLKQMARIMNPKM